MSQHPQNVECPEHGRREATFVCQHLVKGHGLGFHQGFSEDEPDAIYPDAWCEACEAVRRSEGEWNRRSEVFAAIKLICSACYERARLLNWPRGTHAELALLLERSVPYPQEKQDILRTQYRLGDYERYDWQQDTAQLVFSHRGTPVLLADIQFVGSVSSHSNTWLWSWANQSILESAKSRIRQVRAYGEELSLLKLACAFWAADEEDGWQMAAISAFIPQAKGAYRSPDEGAFTFLVMTDVGWAH